MTITKQNSAHTRYIFEAVDCIRLARAAELQFEHGNASKLYDTAIHLFIAGVSTKQILSFPIFSTSFVLQGSTLVTNFR
jgi:hypothetical protein